MKRRGWGEGSPEELPNGRWRVWVSLGMRSDGRRNRKLVYGQTKDDALASAAQMRAKHRAGVSVDRGQRLAEYLEVWLGGIQHRLAATSIRSYRMIARRQLMPRLGHIRIDQITRGDVDRMLADMTREGYSPRYVNHARTILSAALQEAVRDRLLDANVARLSHRMPQRRQQHAIMQPEDLPRLLEVAGRYAPLYTCAVMLGLRQSELLGLQWSDITERHVRVRHKLERIEGRWLLSQTKTEQSRRTVPVPQAVRVALAEQRRQQDEERQQTGWVEIADLDLVFRTRRGLPFDGPHVTKMLQRHLERAGLPRMRFHDLRHTYATLLYRQSVDLKRIQELLGHTTIATTVDIYTATDDDHLQEAADRLDDLFSGASGK